MPRVGDCKKGKIYTIRSHQTDLVYIGSTTQRLAQRIGTHRKNYRMYKDGKFNNISSFEILKHEDHYIELLEDYPCDNVNQLRKREGEWIRSKEKCVNTNIVGRAKNEYREEIKDYFEHTNKIWRDENKEYIAEKRKEYYEKNKEILLEKISSINQQYLNVSAEEVSEMTTYQNI